MIGAASQIGYDLLPQLVAAGHEVVAVSRSVAPRDTRGARWLRLDLSDPGRLAASGVRARSVVSLAPIRIVPPLIDAFADVGAARVIAFSSTSRFTKAASADPAERALAAELLQSEEALAYRCDARGIDCTLFRPTLVYSPGLDRNVSEIGRFILRFGFFPIVGRGRGKRQPVHAADLAAACAAAIARSEPPARAYNLSGGETLTYRGMVLRIFQAFGRDPRLVTVPPALLKTAVQVARVVPRLRKLSPELVTRMNTDMCFDHVDAARDLGFQPRRFEFRVEGESAFRRTLDSGFAG